MELENNLPSVKLIIMEGVDFTMRIALNHYLFKIKAVESDELLQRGISNTETYLDAVPVVC